MSTKQRPPNSPFEFLELKTILRIPPWGWIAIISLLFALTTIGHFLEVKAFGKMSGYTPNVSMLFVPIYEELLFRGVLLAAFIRLYGFLRAALLTSILFGLWHLKNIFWLDQSVLLEQIAYTGLFFGPIMAWVTWKTRSVWPAVVLHYLNNFESPIKGWLSLLQ